MLVRWIGCLWPQLDDSWPAIHIALDFITHPQARLPFIEAAHRLEIGNIVAGQFGQAVEQGQVDGVIQRFLLDQPPAIPGAAAPPC